MQKQRRKYLSKILISRVFFSVVILLMLFSKSAKAEINDDNMLILEPVVQKYTLKDYAYAYESAGKVFLSLPEMSLYTGLKYKLKEQESV